jgi:hypothetical protein
VFVATEIVTKEIYEGMLGDIAEMFRDPTVDKDRLQIVLDIVKCWGEMIELGEVVIFNPETLEWGSAPPGQPINLR